MATKQSSLLSNRGSVTSAGTPNDPALEGGRMRIATGTVALATGDLDVNDIVMLAGVPTGATIKSIMLASDDLDSNAGPTIAFHLGVYKNADDTAENGDEDVYATAVADFQSPQAFTEYAFEARGIELNGQKVWQDAGDTADPLSEYFIGIKWSTGPATAQAGDVSFQIVYSDA